MEALRSLTTGWRSAAHSGRRARGRRGVDRRERRRELRGRRRGREQADGHRDDRRRGQRLVFSDTGALIQSTECAGGGTDTVTCEGLIPGWSANLGDMTDVLAAAGNLEGGMLGGYGDDILSGSETNEFEEFIEGGEGNDQIFGRGGQDFAVGETGDDRVDGGPGRDRRGGRRRGHRTCSRRRGLRLVVYTDVRPRRRRHVRGRSDAGFGGRTNFLAERDALSIEDVDTRAPNHSAADMIRRAPARTRSSAARARTSWTRRGARTWCLRARATTQSSRGRSGRQGGLRGGWTASRPTSSTSSTHARACDGHAPGAPTSTRPARSRGAPRAGPARLPARLHARRRLRRGRRSSSSWASIRPATGTRGRRVLAQRQTAAGTNVKLTPPRGWRGGYPGAGVPGAAAGRGARPVGNRTVQKAGSGSKSRQAARTPAPPTRATSTVAGQHANARRPPDQELWRGQGRLSEGLASGRGRRLRRPCSATRSPPCAGWRDWMDRRRDRRRGRVRRRRPGVTLLRDHREAGHNAAADIGIRHAVAGGFERVLLVPGDTPLLDPGEVAGLLERWERPASESRSCPTGTEGTNGLLIAPPDAFAPASGPTACAATSSRRRAPGCATPSSRSTRWARCGHARGPRRAGRDARGRRGVAPPLPGACSNSTDRRGGGRRPGEPRRRPEHVILRASGLPEIAAGDDLAGLLAAAAPDDLAASDVLVVAHKVVSKAEGRTRRLADIEPGVQARVLARQHGKDARLVQAVLDETASLLRAERGILICETHHGLVCANAGVDQSNAPEGELILLPEEPDSSARALRAGVAAARGVAPAVVVATPSAVPGGSDRPTSASVRRRGRDGRLARQARCGRA